MRHKKGGLLCLMPVLSLVLSAPAPDKKPNFVIIWGDDIGITNISAYSHGLLGYDTPNIDRLAKEGVMFTDYYGEQSWYRGPFRIYHRPKRLSHRLEQSGRSGRVGRPSQGRSDDR